MAVDVDAFDPAGEWLRHVPHGADPRIRPQPPGDNRWQRGSVVDALYLVRNVETLWAEWYRHLAEQGIPPLRQIPRDVRRFRVPSLNVADLGTPDRLARVGLPVPEPGRQTWPPYQELGESLFQAGWQGLIAPSAAHPDGLILCLFLLDANRLPAEPTGQPQVVSEPPAPPPRMRT